MEDGRTVLIVHDNSGLRERLGRVVLDAGFAPDGVPCGSLALEYLRREEAPCLVLLVLSCREFEEGQKVDPELADIPVLVLGGGVRGPG